MAPHHTPGGRRPLYRAMMRLTAKYSTQLLAPVGYRDVHLLIREAER
jgi:hypothetical protein